MRLDQPTMHLLRAVKGLDRLPLFDWRSRDALSKGKTKFAEPCLVMGSAIQRSTTRSTRVEGTLRARRHASVKRGWPRRKPSARVLFEARPAVPQTGREQTRLVQRPRPGRYGTL